MPLVSLTRLRLQSWRSYPGFGLFVFRSIWQSLRADGLVGLQLLRDRQHAYWTLTLWQDMQSMEAFRNRGAHGAAMRHLARWCDESAAAQRARSIPAPAVGRGRVIRLR